MQLAKFLQKTKYKCHKFAAFLRLVLGFHGKNKEAGSLLSRAGTSKQKESSAMFNFCKIYLHTKTEKKMLTKT